MDDCSILELKYIFCTFLRDLIVLKKTGAQIDLWNTTRILIFRQLDFFDFKLKKKTI